MIIFERKPAPKKESDLKLHQDINGEYPLLSYTDVRNGISRPSIIQVRHALVYIHLICIH